MNLKQRWNAFADAASPISPYPYAASDIQRLRAGAKTTLVVSLIFQIAVMIGSAIGWLRFGAAPLPLVQGLAAMTLVSIIADWLFWREIQRPMPISGSTYVAPLFWAGALSLVGFVSLATKVLSYVSMTLSQWLFAGPILLIAVIIFVAQSLDLSASARESSPALPRVETRPIVWVGIWAGLVLAPLAVGWLRASAAIPSVRDDQATVRHWLDTHAARTRKCAPWTVNGEPLRAAVLLSGGGYRAAVTHAGVLAALDDQCVPIDLLSAVSGGSIIAASYALGVPPREFADDLMRQKPGLPDMLLSVLNVFKSPSELYGEHFRNQYFGDRTLDKLPDSPTLLLNVTNLYSTPAAARETVFKNPAHRQLQRQVHIADAVAASGAFPGAFQPVKLRWETVYPDKTEISDHRLVDGGVVENLGIEGLRQYFQRMSWLEWYWRRPHILIISDASGYAGSAERMVINPAADEALLRAADIQFDILHRLLYNELTGKDDLSLEIAGTDVWRQYYPMDFPARLAPKSPKPGTRIKVASANGFGEVTVAPQKLTTVVIPSTAEAIRKLLEKHPACVGPNGEPAADVQTRVSALSTLYELNPTQARQAYWLGYALGQLYGQAIECARRELAGNSCEAAPPTPALTCEGM